MMEYVSTRGKAPHYNFGQATLAGLASDGGLYVPQQWHKFETKELLKLRGQSFSSIAYEIIKRFTVDEFDDKQLTEIIDRSYASFRHSAVTPLVQLTSSTWVLELFHGPTLAFKDVAMQLLGNAMDVLLARQNLKATIIGATSGDTGSAAIHAFRGKQNVDLFILYPNGKVSDIQRKQMTTAPETNIHALAVDGNFDDCQALLKAAFQDKPFREQIGLSGVNSINLARIIPQIIYYFAAGLALGAPNRPVRFVVPTGNFGDIYAGWVAKQMGLPIEKLVIATNVNDILHRCLTSGNYDTRPVQATAAPSIDIQVSSNFERLLFEYLEHDPQKLSALMDDLRKTGKFRLNENVLQKFQEDFLSCRTDENEMACAIQTCFNDCGYILDPHTAVAAHAANTLPPPENGIPTVILATAHPAKFPDFVRSACGVKPELPEALREITERPERIKMMKNDLNALKQFVLAHSRVK